MLGAAGSRTYATDPSHARIPNGLIPGPAGGIFSISGVRILGFGLLERAPELPGATVVWLFVTLGEGSLSSQEVFGTVQRDSSAEASE